MKNPVTLNTEHWKSSYHYTNVLSGTGGQTRLGYRIPVLAKVTLNLDQKQTVPLQQCSSWKESLKKVSCVKLFSRSEYRRRGAERHALHERRLGADWRAVNFNKCAVEASRRHIHFCVSDELADSTTTTLLERGINKSFVSIAVSYTFESSHSVWKKLCS